MGGADREKRKKDHQGTCIKDTWTKPKGIRLRVAGGDGWSDRQWWGENGDNCTWITIKKEKRERNMKKIKRKKNFKSLSRVRICKIPVGSIT